MFDLWPTCTFAEASSRPCYNKVVASVQVMCQDQNWIAQVTTDPHACLASVPPWIS